MNLFEHIGRYFMMLAAVFSRPEKGKVFRKRFLEEIDAIVVSSIPLVAFLSIFMGAVIALQTASSMSSPLLPDYTVGYITRSSTVLEFSPTIISLIIAGKVGSNIASEIGTMRVTEQIDALTSIVFCKSRTKGEGLIPKIGSRLPHAPIGLIKIKN